MTPLQMLDRLTDAEADNLHTAQRQGDLDSDLTLTWGPVLESWLQMPDEVQERMGPSGSTVAELDRALLMVIFRHGLDADVLDTYAAGW